MDPTQPVKETPKGMKRRTRIFLLLSVLLLISDSIFVTLNYHFSRRALVAEQADQGRQAQASYHVVMREQLDSMLLLAYTFAAREDIQLMMLAARNTVEREGGGPGGEQAAEIRNRLYAEVGELWEFLIHNFDVRQLHFHLGPGDLSFLRVHRPERFGDRMDELRFTIVDTNQQLTARTGFETGRVYSGIRGVVPLFAYPDGRKTHVGALEVGTSFKPILQVLDNSYDMGWATLLKKEHVANAMWPEFVAKYFAATPLGCDCVLEASTRPEIRDFIEAGVFLDRQERLQNDIIAANGRHYAISHWPLRDYLGDVEPQRDSVGRIVVWRDISDRVAAFHHDQWLTIAYAISAWLIVEILLYFVIRLGTRKLEEEVDQRTAEIRDLNAQLQQQANTDALTGILNRRAFMERLEPERRRASRGHTPLSLVIIDFDLFKQINDQHGHPAGDAVLQQVTRTIAERLRISDLFARIGGEEFAIVLPDTNQQDALRLANTLRQSVAETPIQLPDHPPLQVSISLGVAAWHPEEEVRQWFAAADEALYRAKSEGRNACEGR
jgi:diguanylate cyclase (GGDEF)-like protein